jgi:hypothetical protein
MRHGEQDHLGVFVGGPPLLSREEAIRLIEHPEEVEAEMREALKEALRRTPRRKGAVPNDTTSVSEK